MNLPCEAEDAAGSSIEGVSKSAHDLISEARGKGATIWLENDQLHYRSPKGVLTRECVEQLKRSKASVVSLLRVSSDNYVDGAKSFDARTGVYRVPLSFSQIAHWNLYRLADKPSACVIPALTRIRGAADSATLMKALAEIVRRHDALRTRIVVSDGIPMQEIDPLGTLRVSVDDWTRLPRAERESELYRLSSEPPLINVVEGPLLRARLIKLDRNDCALLVHMEHMISDGRSMGIFHEELFTAYAQVARGQLFSLPEISRHFSDSARLQRDSRSLTSDLSVYLHEYFSGCDRVRFPAAMANEAGGSAGTRVIKFSIDNQLRVDLSEWCRARGTTLVMGAFTAYVALALRWCDTREMVVLFQTDGRSFADVGASIGYYAFPLYLRAQLRDQDTFLDLMMRLKEEYCRAYEHAGFSYLEAQVPRPGFTRNCCFNWLPESPESERFEVDGNGGKVSFQRIEIEQQLLWGIERDMEPMFGVLERSAEVIGSISFPADRLSAESMEKFSANYLSFMRSMIRRQKVIIRDLELS